MRLPERERLVVFAGALICYARVVGDSEQAVDVVGHIRNAAAVGVLAAVGVGVSAAEGQANPVKVVEWDVHIPQGCGYASGKVIVGQGQPL